MMITIVYPVLNQYKLFASVLNRTISNLNLAHEVELLIIDNDSDEGGQKLQDALNNIGIDWSVIKRCKELKIISNNVNVGNYPIFKQAFQFAQGKIIAFFHSDFYVHEKGWDERVLNVFSQDDMMGLIGFIGSNEIDNFGGRGMGTKSNFVGMSIDGFNGSPAEVHGARITDLKPAAVVDGCSMIFKRKCLFDIGFIEDFPPHHFYDRLMCCQAIEKGYKVGVLGIQSDHISGQTANKENKYHNIAKKWIQEKLGIDSPEDYIKLFPDWYLNTMNPSRGNIPKCSDQVIYQEAERRFLQEWRDNKKFIPIMLNDNYGRMF